MRLTERFPHGTDVGRGFPMSEIKNAPNTGYGSKLYWVWDAMKKRCMREYHPKYPRYGGRGITVCEEWHSYDVFAEWAVSNGYAEGLSLDRIDNDGNYEPRNCRWATRVQQSRNTCQNVPLQAFGIVLLAGEWSEITGLHKRTIQNRVARGMDIEDALTLPVMSMSERGRRGRAKQLAYRRPPERSENE
jgi:hypothetical protein